MVATPRPARRHEWSHQRPQPAPTEQDAHAEHGPAGGINAAPVHRKLARSHHRKNDPAWSHHQFSGLGKDRRQ